MAATVHPSAVVDAGAELADDVEVGPLCVLGDGVSIGPGTRLVARCTVLGPTRLGARNVVYPGACLGAPPQDRSYDGEPTELVVGDDNVVREQVTVHRGTAKGGGVTRIGSRCLLMVGAHVAHDCVLEDDVTLTNLATLGGHVTVGQGAVLGGHTAVAPFARLGAISFLAGGAMVERDVPPFAIAAGDRARVRALNVVGLKRNGVPEASRQALDRAFKMIWLSGQPVARGLDAVRMELGTDDYVARLVSFLESSR